MPWRGWCSDAHQAACQHIVFRNTKSVVQFCAVPDMVRSGCLARSGDWRGEGDNLFIAVSYRGSEKDWRLRDRRAFKKVLIIRLEVQLCCSVWPARNLTWALGWRTDRSQKGESSPSRPCGTLNVATGGSYTSTSSLGVKRGSKS